MAALLPPSQFQCLHLEIIRSEKNKFKQNESCSNFGIKRSFFLIYVKFCPKMFWPLSVMIRCCGTNRDLKFSNNFFLVFGIYACGIKGLSNWTGRFVRAETNPSLLLHAVILQTLHQNQDSLLCPGLQLIWARTRNTEGALVLCNSRFIISYLYFEAYYVNAKAKRKWITWLRWAPIFFIILYF